MLVTVDDLTKYMDVDFSTKQREGVQFILAGLQSELEAYLGRPIEIRSFTESYFVRPESNGWIGFGEVPVSLSNYGAYSIGLRQSPVHSVTAVYFSSVGGASVTPVLQIQNRDYVIRPFGIDVINGISTLETVTVTYTAGMDGTQFPVFKHLILRAGSREAQNLHDDNRGIQNLETREAAPALPTGFNEQELNSVKRYKRQRI
jgi:hypothetical protein